MFWLYMFLYMFAVRIAGFGRFRSWPDVYAGKNRLKLTAPTGGQATARVDPVEAMRAQ